MRRTRAGLLAMVIGATWFPGCAQAPPEPAGAAGTDTTAKRREFWQTYASAGTARSEGRLGDAIDMYTRALALQPGHEDSLYYLGNCQLEQGEFDRALDTYRRLLALNPEGSSRAYMQIASIRASLDERAPFDAAEAADLFRRALEVDPDSGALLGLAEVAVLQEQYDEAEALLTRVEADNAMSIAAPYLQGYLAFRKGDETDAWSRFTTAVARGEIKKGSVKWTEEGDVKGTPELRWRALARQSVFGPHWIRRREYLRPPGPSRADMRREYGALHDVLSRR